MADREKVIKETKDGIAFAESRGFGGLANTMRDALELLKEQQPKTGHWIYQSQFNTMWDNTCSECGKLFCCERGTYANYCWNCGAKMEKQP